MKYFIKLRRLISTFSSPKMLYPNACYFYFKRYSHEIRPNDMSQNENNNVKISTLYVPGRYGSQMYQFVKPLIDVDFIEKNAAEIEKACQLRCITLNLEYISSVFRDWISKQKIHQNIVDKVRQLEEERKNLKELNLSEECTAMDKLINECLDQVKIAKTIVHDMEDIVMPLAQKIPNVIDKDTPIEADCATVHSEPCSKTTLSHVDIATAHSLLEFNNVSVSAYYLKGPLAELELHCLNYFSENLQRELYSPMACVDFCKSFISEATGRDPYSYDSCIPLKNPKSKSSKVGQSYHLIGGASFESFCAYLTNMNTSVETLPVKYFALGRHYEARNRLATSPSLFSVVQSSRIHSMILCDSLNESAEFESMLKVLRSVYECLKIPFRTVKICAPNLNIAESQRVQLELWSPAKSCYVPVAYVSKRNDFVSKRLNITYGVQHNVEGYCSMVEGVVVNVPVLLGCLIENFVNSDKSLPFDELFKLLDFSK